MSIEFRCQCGKKFRVGEEAAGKVGKCPACGSAIKVPAASAAPVSAAAPVAAAVAAPAAVSAPDADPVVAVDEYDVSDDAATAPAAAPMLAPVPSLQYQSAGAPSGMIAAPPADHIQIPIAVASKFQNPSAPPCHLVISSQGADVVADFDVSPALQAMVDHFAKKLRKKFNVIMGPPTGGDPVITFVRIVRIDQGNRWLRYLFGLFAGHAILEVGGTVKTVSGATAPLKAKHRAGLGLFGGSGLGLLKLDGKMVGGKLAKQVLKATR